MLSRLRVSSAQTEGRRQHGQGDEFYDLVLPYYTCTPPYDCISDDDLFALIRWCDWYSVYRDTHIDPERQRRHGGLRMDGCLKGSKTLVHIVCLRKEAVVRFGEETLHSRPVPDEGRQVRGGRYEQDQDAQDQDSR